MKKFLYTLFVFFTSLGVANAQTPSVATQAACFVDYVKFCNGIPIGNVKACFTQNVLQLTNTCINSLINDGFTSREEIDAVRGIVATNTGTPPPPVKKTITERVTSVVSNTVRKVTEAVKKYTKPKVNAKARTNIARKTYRRPGPRPFTDQRANDSFCRDMMNEWPGCNTRF